MESVSKLSSSPRICEDMFRNEGFWGFVFMLYFSWVAYSLKMESLSFSRRC